MNIKQLAASISALVLFGLLPLALAAREPRPAKMPSLTYPTRHFDGSWVDEETEPPSKNGNGNGSCEKEEEEEQDKDEPGCGDAEEEEEEDGGCGEEEEEEEPEILLCDNNILDRWYDHHQKVKECWHVPVSIGAWHWFHESLVSSDDGYGIRGLRGTYWWFVNADPEWEMCDGTKVGGHLEYRLRDGDPFRSFFDSNFWSYEAYGYIEKDGVTLKAGQLLTRFGLLWDGVFFGNAPYFDGFKLDPDYGISLESTLECNDNFKVERYLQFFFHEDSVNGSFEGAGPESISGYTEKYTGIVRVVPTWTCEDGSSLALGFSALAGQIEDTGSGLGDHTQAAAAVDFTYSKDNWKIFGEVFHSDGLRHPVNYVSGGPSNKNTGSLFGFHYVTGPVTWRCSYSSSTLGNPFGQQNMVVAGTTIKLSKGVDLYFEYVNQQVENGSNGFVEFFNSLEAVIYWKY